MQIFKLNPFKCERKYCFVTGAFPYDKGLQNGLEVLPAMTAAGVSVLEYDLDEGQGGLEIGDYFTTVTNHLPVTRRFADAIGATFNLGRHEFVPTRIRNEKGRIHVKDAVIVNPLDVEDCLDWDRSELNTSKKKPLVRIYGKWSLKADRVPAERDLFRVKGLIGYLFSERLVAFIREEKFKNFQFVDAALS